MGPYDTEREAAAEPMPRAVAALHHTGQTRASDPDRLVRNTILRHLVAACDHAGVNLGVYDLRVLTWLAGFEPAVAQAIIGIIGRANRGSCTEPGS